MATPIHTRFTGEIWDMSLEELLAPMTEMPRLGGDGPFVINLSTASTPLDATGKALSGIENVHVYQIQRIEDRRLRYRLRIGPFAREDDADAALIKVREIYPGALTATAGEDDLQTIGALQARGNSAIARSMPQTAPSEAPRVVTPAPTAVATPTVVAAPTLVATPPMVPAPIAVASPKAVTAPVAPTAAIAAPTIAAPKVVAPTTTNATMARVAPIPPAATAVTAVAGLAKPVPTPSPKPAPVAAKSVAAALRATAPGATAPGATTPGATTPGGSTAGASTAGASAAVAAKSVAAAAARAPTPKPAGNALPPLPGRATQATVAAATKSLESTQTVRPLTPLELAADDKSQWYVIQLSIADETFDPDSLPNLDIFSVYRLYSVAALEQGRVVHALRLGFFGAEIAARAVMSYVSAYYDKATITRVSVAERERFATQRLEARKDVGATGRHAVIEITDQRVVRERRTTPTNDPRRDATVSASP